MLTSYIMKCLVIFCFIFMLQNVDGKNYTDWFNNCDHLIKCMNLPPIVEFPFWGGQGNWRPRECGYPEMEIRCDNGVNATMIIHGMSYEVLQVDVTGKNLLIAREDYANGSCLKSFANTTLDYKRFSYGLDTLNITALYGCSRPKSKVDGKFKCAIKGAKENLGYYTRGVANAANYGCHAAVIVPIQDMSEPQLSILGIGRVFRKGFEVNYRLNDKDDALCQKCEGETSKGRCGYDQKLNKTICVCKYGTEDVMCRGNLTFAPKTSHTNSGKKKSKTTLIIGLCVGGGLVALGLAIFIAWIVRSRHLRETQNLTSDNHSPTQQSPQVLLAHSYPSPNSILEESSSYMGLRLFSHSELEAATDNFSIARELGEGAFATVYYGQLEDGTEVAVKRFHRKNISRTGQFMNEVSILARLQHENLVKMYGCTSRSNRDILLVYEFVSNGTVADHLFGKLSNTGTLPWQLRLRIATETAGALCFLHQNEVIHRDVKSANILLDSTFKVKVADFGLARLFPGNTSHISTVPQGTPGYVDPQYHRCYRLSEKSDVYSFGVVLIELISSKVALDITRANDDANLALMAIDRIQNNAITELVDPTLGYGVDPIVRKIIDSIVQVGFRCLQEDGALRPTMQEVFDDLVILSQ